MFCAVLSGWLDTERMATVVGRRRSRHVTPELPGLSIELSGVSAKPRDQVMPAAEARIAADATRVVCGERSCQLYPGDVSGTLFTALSLPCLVPVPFAAGRRAVPRIVLGDAVVQRRRWLVDTRGEGAPFGAVRPVSVRSRPGAEGSACRTGSSCATRTSRSLCSIDFRDPFGVDDLCRLPPARMTCTEVLPDLTDTWWRGGGSQPAELRDPRVPSLGSRGMSGPGVVFRRQRDPCRPPLRRRRPARTGSGLARDVRRVPGPGPARPPSTSTPTAWTCCSIRTCGSAGRPPGRPGRYWPGPPGRPGRRRRRTRLCARLPSTEK